MDYSPLIQRSDLTQIRDISANVPDDRIAPYIREAHDLDLRSFLGDDLYAEIMSQAVAGTLTGDNTTLINTYLKRPLCFYAYARMLEGQPAHVTRYGVVRKENDFSENLSVGDLQKLADMARKSANAYMEQARKFLNENYATYPLWETVGNQGSGNWGINIKAIG